MIDSITKFASKATILPDVYEALVPPRALSFTEIWLDALSAPPGRERLLPLSVGATLNNRYEIIRILGAGGQGTVYLAADRQDNSQVVLKETILPVYTDLMTRRQALESFHKEAFALESVKHSNIVKFLRLRNVVCDHRAYLVLEFIQGKTLSQTIKEQGALSAEQCVKYGVAMCDMLDVLHSLTPPLVHRDFTPDNLIVTDDGSLVLIDFAVAVAGDGESQDTAGKASYMAPEQFKGRPTVQSDIYSLGCTLFYALTAHPAEPLEEAHPILFNDSVPLALSDVVARSTQSISDRTASAQLLKSELIALRA